MWFLVQEFCTLASNTDFHQLNSWQLGRIVVDTDKIQDVRIAEFRDERFSEDHYCIWIHACVYSRTMKPYLYFIMFLLFGVIGRAAGWKEWADVNKSILEDVESRNSVIMLLRI